MKIFSKNTYVIERTAEGLVASYYLKFSEIEIMNRIDEEVQRQVLEQCNKIGDKISKIYSDKISRKVTNTIRRELKGLKQ